MSSGFGENPYQTPVVNQPGMNQPNVRGKLMPPGIALVIAGLLSFFLMGGYFLLTLVIFLTDTTGRMSPPPELAGAERIGFYIGAWGMILLMGLQPMLQIFVVLGGFNMIRGRGLMMARFACILSVIPLCSACCVFGIPFGVWGLIVLSDPQVQESMK